MHKMNPIKCEELIAFKLEWKDAYTGSNIHPKQNKNISDFLSASKLTNSIHRCKNIINTFICIKIHANYITGELARF